MSITEEIQKPISQKIYIAEIDINKVLGHAFNFRAFTYIVNLDVAYAFIASEFLNGVDDIWIANIGSMKSDGVLLSKVANAAAVQTTDLTFYWDLAARDLYFRLQNGDEPELHRVTIGDVHGFSKPAVNFAEFGYEGRLISFPGIDRTKDPLNFGKLSYPGGRIEIHNEDGFFDTFCEDSDTVEAVCRVKQGFRGFAYADFMQTAEGIAERYSIGPSVFAVEFRDRRAKLEKKIPTGEFEQTTYPDLKDGNIGKSIPAPYGTLRNVPVICTNEAEAPAPANYDFKLGDTTYHSIKAITEVRVDGVAKVPSATDLSEATFSLAAADYSPGDKVTADIRGYIGTGLNILYNPGCEKTEAPYIKGDGSSTLECTFERSSEEKYNGDYSFKMVHTNGGSYALARFADNQSSSDLHGFVPGGKYKLKARVKVPSVGGCAVTEVNIVIGYYYSGAWHYSIKLANPDLDTWSLMETALTTIPAIATGVSAWMQMDNTVSTGEYIYVDDIELIAVDDPWLIENPLDVIEDLLTTHYPINFDNNFFDVGEWGLAKIVSPDIHYLADKPIEIEKIIEEICNSTFVSILSLPDGRYTARYFNQSAPAVQTFPKEQLLETPTIEVDSTQMLRYVRVGYDRDWAENDFKYYPHDGGEERVDRQKTFETLLIDQVDVLAFAGKVLQIVGVEYKPFDTRLKLQALEREVMDIIEVEIWRPKKKMLGWVRAEILGIHQDPEQAGMTLNCRVVEVLP